MRLRSSLALLLAVAGIACSHVRIARVTAGTSSDEGLRFFRPWPYLLVTVDRSDLVQATIVYLPDRSEEYVIEPKVGLGSVDVKVALDDGWQLASLGASSDSRVPETIEAVSELIGAASSVAAAPRDHPAAFPLAPGLYRLVYHGAHASGVERVDLGSP